MDMKRNSSAHRKIRGLFYLIKAIILNLLSSCTLPCLVSSAPCSLNEIQITEHYDACGFHHKDRYAKLHDVFLGDISLGYGPNSLARSSYKNVCINSELFCDWPTLPGFLSKEHYLEDLVQCDISKSMGVLRFLINDSPSILSNAKIIEVANTKLCQIKYVKGLLPFSGGVERVVLDFCTPLLKQAVNTSFKLFVLKNETRRYQIESCCQDVINIYTRHQLVDYFVQYETQTDNDESSNPRKGSLSSAKQFPSQIKDLEIAKAKELIMGNWKSQGTSTSIHIKESLHLCNKSMLWIRLRRSSVAILLAASFVYVLFGCIVPYVVSSSSHDYLFKGEKNSIATISTTTVKSPRAHRNRKDDKFIPYSKTDSSPNGNANSDSDVPNLVKTSPQSNNNLLDSQPGSLTVIIEDKRRNRRKKKGANGGGQNGNPLSPATSSLVVSPNVVQPIKAKNPFTQVPHQNTTEANKLEEHEMFTKTTRRPVLNSSATFPCTGRRGSPVILAPSSSVAPHARAPGSNLYNQEKPIVAKEKGCDEFIYYDIWGDHFYGLHLLGRSKEAPAMMVRSSSREKESTYDSFFVRGPTNLPSIG